MSKDQSDHSCLEGLSQLLSSRTRPGDLVNSFGTRKDLTNCQVLVSVELEATLGLEFDTCREECHL